MVEFTYREFKESDIADIASIANLQAERDGDEDRLTEDMLQHLLKAPFISAEEDFKVFLNAKGETIGVTLAIVNPRTGQSQANAILHPDYPAREIKPKMLDLCLDMVHQRGLANVPEDKPIYVITGATDNKTEDIAIFEDVGFTETRRFYEMRITLDDTVPAPQFPDGLELRPFDPEIHGRAAHAAQQESFRDHWGHSEDRPYDEWVHRFTAPNFDPNLWFILWDVEQEEIAGFSMCSVSPTIPDMGSVDLLGVRRPWRKRGLGMALLKQSFYGFQQKGFTRVGLGVDAASKTNAVALYENAGMDVHRCTIILRKILRGNAEDIVD
ncbi:MAG: GNAT family N-acetyltransferase [Aggregatilineales bacterium]